MSERTRITDDLYVGEEVMVDGPVLEIVVLDEQQTGAYLDEDAVNRLIEACYRWRNARAAERPINPWGAHYPDPSTIGWVEPKGQKMPHGLEDA